MNEQVNLSNCDREPIHIPGSVQPFGFLLTLLSDFTICMASENAGDFLGTDCAALLQRPVEEVLSKAAVDTIRARVDYLSGPDAVERIFGLQLQPGKPPFDVAAAPPCSPQPLTHRMRPGLLQKGRPLAVHAACLLTAVLAESERQIVTSICLIRIMLVFSSRCHSGKRGTCTSLLWSRKKAGAARARWR